MKGSTLAHHGVPRSRPTATVFLAGSLLIGGLAIWTFRPIGPADLTPFKADPSPQQHLSEETAPLDLVGFERPVFTIAAEPDPVGLAFAPPPAPPPPPPPLRLELLAIERGADGLRAVLFDPDENTVVTVIQGDDIAGRSVTLVAAEGVVFKVGDVEQSLVLRADRPIVRGGVPR